MYKKIELLNKKDHKDLSVDKINSYSFAKELKYAPTGLSEISKLSIKFPVFITGGEDNHFAVLLSVGENDNYFSLNNKHEDKRFIPNILKTYPFLMVDAKDKNNTEETFRAIALDVESEFIGKKKKFKLFEDDKETTTLKDTISFVQFVDKDRFEADKLIQTLKEYKLLDKRSITLKVDEGEAKTILSDFYVVNQERLYQLDDTILLEWMKKGWTYLLETHMRSIENIDLLLSQSMKPIP